MQQTQVQWVADRALLRSLKRRNPSLSVSNLADACHRSRSWVKKWLARFKQVQDEDETVLYDHPSTPKTPRPPTNSLLVDRILEAIMEEARSEKRGWRGRKAS